MVENLKNKYVQKLQEYLNEVEEKGEVVNMKYCAKLRKKAEDLEHKKNLELFDLINTSKNVNLNKVQYLLETGADINAKFKDDLTPYMVAALNAKIDVLDLLKEEGADVEAKTVFGQNALMLACLIRDNFTIDVKRTYLKVVKKLMEHGVGDKMHVDNAGVTRDDYLLGKTQPFTETYLNLVETYFNSRSEDYELLR